MVSKVKVEISSSARRHWIIGQVMVIDVVIKMVNMVVMMVMVVPIPAVIWLILCRLESIYGVVALSQKSRNALSVSSLPINLTQQFADKFLVIGLGAWSTLVTIE